MLANPICVWLLLIANALINIYNVDKNMAIHCTAIYFCGPASTCKLIGFGADPNSKRGQGRMALYFAILINRALEIIDYLISYRANIEANDIYNMSAIITALWENKKEIFIWLV